MPSLPIPFPLSNAPGAFNQEESGRLINAYAEPLGTTIPKSRPRLCRRWSGASRRA